MNVVAIIQARVGSTRLPAKVLLDLGGATALQRCLERVGRFQGVTSIVVATTDRPEDELIVALARRLGVRTTRGSAEDVLARYIDAGRETKADVIVRCTSDCPLLDAELSSKVIRDFLHESDVDYASNNLQRRLPRGLDTEVVSMPALERANRDARSPVEREHVTPHLYRNPSKFRLLSVSPDSSEDHSGQRWTLDTLDDYRFLSAVFDRLGPRARTASMRDVLDILSREPHLTTLNAHVEQKQVT